MNTLRFFLNLENVAIFPSASSRQVALLFKFDADLMRFGTLRQAKKISERNFSYFATYNFCTLVRFPKEISRDFLSLIRGK